LPEPAQAARPGDAVAFLADLLRREPTGTVDLHALGPLTNIARLIRDHRDAADRIGRLIVMGGAIQERGNVGPRAEFNLAVDPEAAAIVFGAGLATTLI
ncbi:nucleoside hydrolase, partial [Mycobacterium tuberculosis]|nr:nucleoside hydrolase [Mycobacterium tuberculosis]